MRIDTHSANAISAVASTPEAEWFDAAAYHAMFTGLRETHLRASAMVGLIGFLALDHAPRVVLLVWGLLVLADFSWRRRVFAEHERLAGTASIDAQLRHARAQEPLWLVQGLFWGLTPLALFQYLPVDTVLLAWAPVGAVGVARAIYMAPHLGSARLYLTTFAACLTLSVTVQLTAGLYDDLGAQRWWLLVVLFGQLVLLVRVVRTNHERSTRSIDLMYQNARLIHSLQEQTRAAQEAAQFRTRFLAGAAHDLKQPINALGIYAEWLSAEPHLVEELGPKILQATQAINTLFDSLFDLARLDAGSFQPKPSTVDVSTLMKDLEVQFRPLAVQKGLGLRVRARPGRVVTDPIMLRRVLGNLVANAIRYTGHGGVLLAVRRRGDALAFEVWDTGLGIAPEQHGNIFREFYKVQTGGTEDGFGLGLAIVRRLSGIMGYQLSLRSRLARGSVFRVLVPIGDGSVSPQGPDARASTMPAGPTGSATRADGRSAASASGS